jgi:hypothetical protein
MFGNCPHLANIMCNYLKNNDRSKPHLAALYLAIIYTDFAIVYFRL